jgi:glycosyltransferase involved in cell wall biosynthesis
VKIVHIRNIANTHRFVLAQRALGHDSQVWSTGHPERKLNKFPVQDNNPWTDPVRWNLWMLSRLKKLREFDVLHLHGGIWRSQVFYKLMKLPPIAIHYHGTELRMAVGHNYQELAKAKFVSTPDQLRWVPDAIWLPQPIELPATVTYRTNNEKPVFSHFYIRDNTKRTHKIIEMFGKAFGPLQHLPWPNADNYVAKDAELWTYHGVPPEQVLSVMHNSDVIFDQMTFYKVYGAVSAEAMAYGKPTLVPIDRSLYPEDCAVMSPSVSTLRSLARDPRLRERVGRQGRAYVERVHDMRKVAQLTIKAYEEALEA